MLQKSQAKETQKKKCFVLSFSALAFFNHLEELLNYNQQAYLFLFSVPL